MTRLRVEGFTLSLDEMHLAISAVLLGQGEHLITGLDLVTLGYAVQQHVGTDTATHVLLTRA